MTKFVVYIKITFFSGGTNKAAVDVEVLGIDIYDLSCPAVDNLTHRCEALWCGGYQGDEDTDLIDDVNYDD